MIRHLLLMRHAKSSWKTDAASDHERPLNRRGRRAAPRVAARLSELGYEPQIVLSSDSVRTVQTWERMSEMFELEAELRLHKSLYHGDMDALRRKLEKLPRSARTVLALGHNPGWEEAAEWLCGENIVLKTADVVILRSKSKRWSDALESRGSWRNIGCIRAREL